MEEFAFNARQYFDFNKDNDDPQDDTYFDLAANENVAPKVTEIPTDKENSDPESDIFFSPTVNPDSPVPPQLKYHLRKSLSMGQLPTDDTNDRMLSVASDELQRGSTEMLHKAPSQDCINRLAQPKRFVSQGNLPLAEAVIKFQVSTPKRFRSKASPKRKEQNGPRHVTAAHSPRLKTTARNRPVYSLSQEERERKEADEARKFKIKAHPVNQRVMRGPLKAQVEVKPTTTVEPFQLTEVAKKTVIPEEKKPSFKAQPMPKFLNNSLKVQSATKAQTPTFLKRQSKTVPTPHKAEEKQNGPTHHPFKTTPTEPKPFSFEQRDQRLMKKKEEFINQVLEKEKKAREFHARPIPKAILRSKNNSETQISEAGASKSVHTRSFEDLNKTNMCFKAKPAVVLQQNPFIPKKDENHCLKVEAFQFTTDERLEARHKFEAKLKEKEAAIEAAKKAKEEEIRRLEEERVAQLRKQMEHKAQPIKKYKPFKIELDHKLTIPISPKFHTDRIRNKENIEH